eukprot:TRINITY_DN3866_c0_g1_i2.p1 TRINITY_DN3866_c0_g1~~TRINITY_DN3866_c0_g1_i2.p1  ORF type:complete len:301 (+),score=61.91 TRINITY_DN3866_c0_g1_i2:167-1069(+)
MTTIVRFLFFPRGNSVNLTVPTSHTFGQIKQDLINEQVKELEGIANGNQFKLIYSGRVIDDDDQISTKFTPDQLNNGDGPITIHVMKNRTPSKPTIPATLPSPTIAEESNNVNSSSAVEEPVDIHYHGMFWGDDDAELFEKLFAKEKGHDGLIGMEKALKFLQTYWMWMSRRNLQDRTKPFPTEQVVDIRRKYIGDVDRITTEQFLKLFFLFDHPSSDHSCADGDKDRVKEAVIRLHESLETGIDFQEQTFDRLFSGMIHDRDGRISCQGLDLLLYLYAAHATHPSLFSNPHNLTSSTSS